MAAGEGISKVLWCYSHVLSLHKPASKQSIVLGADRKMKLQHNMFPIQCLRKGDARLGKTSAAQLVCF